MFETSITVVGHVASDLTRREVGDQEVVKFRVASNSRRRTADGNWEAGNTLFVTVNCWGKLAGGAYFALSKGAPVIVTGFVYTSEYEDREGVRRSSLEMRATTIGPDLSRSFVRFEKPSYAGPTVPETATTASTERVSYAGTRTEDSTEPADPDDADAGAGPLPLSA